MIRGRAAASCPIPDARERTQRARIDVPCDRRSWDYGDSCDATSGDALGHDLALTHRSRSRPASP